MYVRFACVCSVLDMIDPLPTEWSVNPEMFTLQELIDMKKGDLLTRTRDVIAKAEKHVTHCEVYYLVKFFMYHLS